MNFKSKAICAAVLVLSVSASAQSDEAKQKVASLKQALQRDQATLRHYEWIETTIITAKGEEKSREQKQCYYGADGALTKVEVSEEKSDSGRTPRGIRGAIVAKKTEEVTDYMKQAVELVKSYIPPDPAKIQAAADSGKVSIRPTGQENRVVVDVHEYQVGGDTMSFDLDFQNNSVMTVSIQTFLGSDRDPVTLNVSFSKLQDGTGYPAQTVLNAPAKEISVTVDNSGYRKPS